MKIVLIGFMGSGKTAIAKILSKKLKLTLIDMDNLALKKSRRKSINEIFQKDGETKFRQLELVVAKEISQQDKVVISTGGGVVMNKPIMKLLKFNSTIVYLKCSFDKIKERIALKRLRPPLFQNIKSAQKLYNLRLPLYEKCANIIIETDSKNVFEVAQETINRLK